MSSVLTDIPSKITYMAKTLRTLVVAASLFAVVGIRGDAQTPQQGTQPPPQPPPAADKTQQQPTFRTGINFVRVDVILTDRNGNPVSDLQASDFDVTEDGKPQKIETFKLVKLDGGASEAAKEPPRQIRTDDDEEAEAARDDV